MQIANAPVGAGYGYGFTDTKRYTKGLELDNESVGDFLTMDDLLDFSNEDIGGPIEEIYPPNGSLTTTVETVSSFGHADGKSSQWPNIVLSDGPSELCVPCDDLAELEWLSNFVESSFSSRDACPTVLNSGVNSSHDEQDKSRVGSKEFHSSSPISVLESSLCSGKFSGFSSEILVPARARSKRSRSGVCFWNASIFPANTSSSHVESSSTSTITANTSFSPSSDAFIMEQVGAEFSSSRKKCKSNSRKAQDASQNRKCLHCATQRTPQWRAGPLGPKTLCNACGVRYKSGRLLPEYRPAASPTFVDWEHSNSHKRVLEMRRQKGEQWSIPRNSTVRGSSGGYGADDGCAFD